MEKVTKLGPVGASTAGGLISCELYVFTLKIWGCIWFPLEITDIVLLWLMMILLLIS